MLLIGYEISVCHCFVLYFVYGIYLLIFAYICVCICRSVRSAILPLLVCTMGHFTPMCLYLYVWVCGKGRGLLLLVTACLGQFGASSPFCLDQRTMACPC